MLITGKPDKKAGEVPVLADGVEVTRLRRVPPHREWITYTVADRAWIVECTWLEDYQHGWVRARPADAEAPLRATYAGPYVRDVVLEGRPLGMARTSFVKGDHTYTDGGRWLATTDTRGWPRVRITLTADAAVPLHQQLFLLCLDLYTCRRNTGAAGALALVPVPNESYV
jgi:hypothetical protein